MPKPKIPKSMAAADVLRVLMANGVDAFYHADSVQTSISCLKMGGLLSREQGEKHGQSAQHTDAKDKTLGLWNKVFIDTLDIHHQLHKPNYYGPVSFVFDLNTLRSPAIKGIRVSKRNPKYWEASDALEECWCVDVEDFEATYDVNLAWQYSLILTCENGALPFLSNLSKIIVDDPPIRLTPLNKLIYDHTKEQLEANCGTLNVPIEPRNCFIGCKCREIYKEDADIRSWKFRKYFLS